MPIINGTSNADTLNGTSGADTLNGLGGDDLLRGLGGADSIDGGTGYDYALYDNDAANGGGAGVTVNLSTGTATDGFGAADLLTSIEGVRGTAQIDTFTGSNRTDETEQFQGLAGNDTINGLGGNDEVRYDRDASFGGAGAVNVNLVTGLATDGFGNTDTLFNIEWARGTAQADTFLGNGSNNQFRGLAGNDIFDGGGGFDVLRYDSDQGNGGAAGINATFSGTGSGTVIDGFGNTDTFTNIESIRATLLADSLAGSSGNEDFYGIGGNDTLNGGAGFDVARYDLDDSYSGGGNGVTVNLGTGTATDGFGNTDTLVEMDGIWGTRFADSLTGSATDNNFVGGVGADIINGGHGTDNINYFNENQGGLAISANLATGVITDSAGNTDTVSNIEDLRTGNLNDTILGSNVSESFTGNGGNDSFNGAGGADFMRGGLGNDTLNGTAGSGNFTDQSSGDNDTANYNDGGIALVQGAIVNLDAGVAVDGFGGIDTLYDIERVRGTSLADTFLGSATQNFRQERYEGLAGNDTMNGQAGFDVASYQRDRAEGGLAGVTVNLATGVATDGFGTTDSLISMEGVLGTNFADNMVGNSANNLFRTNGGIDIIDGGGGLDSLDFYLDDQIGGAGVIVNMAVNTAVGIDGAVFNFNSIEVIDGSYRNDTIVGSAAADNLSGSLGNDYIDGGDGNDTMNGGAGVDNLIGGAGSDWIGYVFDVTGAAQSQIDAGQYAAFGWLSQNWNWTGVSVNLATGVMSGLDGAVDTFSGFENIFGTYLNDTLTGDAGDNRFRGYSGNDTIDGGGGTDTVLYSRTTSRLSDQAIALMVGDVSNGVNVNLASGVAQDGNGTTDTLSNIENAVGSIGNDTLTGDGLTNVLEGGAGADSIDGGGGWDTASYAGAMGTVQVIMYAALYNSGEAAGDTLTGIEAIQGSAFTDVLVGDFAVNAILGGAGDDWIDGTFGGDYLYGEAGFDNLVSRDQADVIDGGADFDYVRYDFATGSVRAYLYDNSQNAGFAAGDTLTSIEGLIGSYYSDDLRGDGGNNAIFGQGGDDFIIGLAEVDYLNGGAGYDLFHYVSVTDGGATGDVIQDFTSGTDRISITGSLFGLGYLAGGLIESWRFAAGTDAIYATSQFIYNAPTGQLWYDQDGTGAGVKVLLATLQPGATMAAGDFLVL
jgi:Ca2+-binding RTX toxin-like protein